MELKFLEIPKEGANLKATVHATGRLGFTSNAVEKLGINEEKYARIAISDSDQNEENLYLVVEEEEKENSLQFTKAGDYFFLRTKGLFDVLNIDYRKKKIIFDIIDASNEQMRVYKLIRREKDRRKKKD